MPDVVRFYTHSKDGVKFNQKVSPLLTKQNSLKYRSFSNFYHDPGFSFVFDGESYRNSETAFQYHR